MDLVALLLLEEGREPVAAPEPLPADASAASVALLCAQSNFAVLSGEGESALEARRFAFCRDVVRLGATGRGDVGARRRARLVAVCAAPLFALAPQLLAAAEGALHAADAAAAAAAFAGGGGGAAGAADRARAALGAAAAAARAAARRGPGRVAVGGELFRAPPRELDAARRGSLARCGFFGRLARLLRSPRGLLEVLGAVLTERRVLVTGSDPRAVGECAAAVAGLPELYGGGGPPLVWPHVLVTLLPESMLPYAGAPSPYVLGLRKDHLDVVLRDYLGDRAEDVVLVDLDAGAVLAQESSVALRLAAPPEADGGDGGGDVGALAAACAAGVAAATKRADAARRRQAAARRRQRRGARVASAKTAARAAAAKFLRRKPARPAEAAPDSDSDDGDAYAYSEDDDAVAGADCDGGVARAVADFLDAYVGGAAEPGTGALGLDAKRFRFTCRREALGDGPGGLAFAAEVAATQMFAAWALPGAAAAPRDDVGAAPSHERAALALEIATGKAAGPGAVADFERAAAARSTAAFWKKRAVAEGRLDGALRAYGAHAAAALAREEPAALAAKLALELGDLDAADLAAAARAARARAGDADAATAAAVLALAALLGGGDAAVGLVVGDLRGAWDDRNDDLGALLRALQHDAAARGAARARFEAAAPRRRAPRRLDAARPFAELHERCRPAAAVAAFDLLGVGEAAAVSRDRAPTTDVFAANDLTPAKAFDAFGATPPGDPPATPPRDLPATPPAVFAATAPPEGARPPPPAAPTVRPPPPAVPTAPTVRPPPPAVPTIRPPPPAVPTVRPPPPDAAPTAGAAAPPPLPPRRDAPPLPPRR